MNTVTKVTIAVVATVGLVAGGAAYAGKKFMNGMKGEFMIYKLEKELDLSSDQVARLEDIRSYMKAKHESRDHTEGKAKLVAMLSEPQLDQAQVLSMMDDKMTHMRGNAPEFVGKVAGFTDSLSTEQRAELLEMINGFSGRMHKH